MNPNLHPNLSPVRRLLCLLLLSTVAVGCARDAPAPYAARYAAALERYPGSEPVDPAHIEAFVDFFSKHGSTQPADLYAQQLYFSDTLLTSERPEEVFAHLDRMRRSAAELGVTVLDRQVAGADVYLVWRMHATFTPLYRAVDSDTVGMTHLRFDDRGRIVLQQDFWDSAEGFYRHIPGLGALVRAVGNRFAGNAP